MSDVNPTALGQILSVLEDGVRQYKRKPLALDASDTVMKRIAFDLEMISSPTVANLEASGEVEIHGVVVRRACSLPRHGVRSYIKHSSTAMLTLVFILEPGRELEIVDSRVEVRRLLPDECLACGALVVQGYAETPFEASRHCSRHLREPASYWRSLRRRREVDPNAP